MDFCRYIKFDPWWEESYLRLSIKNYKAIPIFHKFLQITGEYKYNFSTLQESYTTKNAEKVLEIKFIDSRNKELAGHNESENHWFYHRFHEHPNYTLEINSNLYPNSEYGQEKKVVDEDNWETWSWVKTKDQLAEKEHYADQATELFTFELKYEKSELKNNKLEKREKVTKFSYYMYEETENIEFDDQEIELKEKITRDLIEKSEVKKTAKSTTVKKSRDYKGFILQVKEVVKPDMKSWSKTLSAKNSAQVLEEFSVEHKVKFSGFKSFKLDEKELKIDWAIVENRFSAEVTIKNNTNTHYYKKFTEDQAGTLEIDYFRIGETHWGSVKDYSAEGSLNMNWKDTESHMHSYYLRQFAAQRDKLSTSPPNASLYSKLTLIQYDADFIFDILETVNLYNNSFFSGMTLQVFYQCNPAFKNFIGTTENLSDKLVTYLDDRNRVNENLNEDNFSGFFKESRLNNSEIVIEQVIRKEKMLRFMIDSVKVSKKSLFIEKFDKEKYFEVFSVVLKLMDSVKVMRKCKDNQVEHSFSVAKYEVVESETLNMFCTVCFSVCHENCQVYLRETNVSFSCNEECGVFIDLKNKSNCRSCLRRCGPKYHMLVRKDVRRSEVRYEETEFNQANERAENYQKDIVQSLETSALFPYLKFIIAHILISTKKRLKKSESTQSLQDEYKDWQEMLRVVNNNGA